MKLSRVRNDTIGIAASVLSAVLFGIAPLLARYAYDAGWSSVMLAFLRFTIGALIVLAVLAIRRERILLPGRILLRIGVISVFYACMILLLYTSYLYIDSGMATTLHFSYPVFVMLLTAVLSRRWPDRIDLLCTILAVAGIVFLQGSAGRPDPRGVLTAAASGLSYAVYIVLTERFSLKKVPAMTLTFWISVYASVYSGICIGLAGQMQFAAAPGGLTAIFLLALTSNACAVSLFQKGMSLCGGIRASLLSTFEPLTSVLVGCLFLSEKLTVRRSIGILLVLAAAVLLVLGGKKGSAGPNGNTDRTSVQG